MTVRPTRPGAASIVALGAALALLATIVFAGEAFPEVDSYYHLRYAALLSSGQLPRGTFPWASASTWATAFADKDWLYHVALVPFVRAFDPDLLAAGKWATLVFAAGLVGAVAFLLARRGAPRPGELALLGMVSSYTFLQRVTVARTLTVAVALVVLLLFALVERRAVLAFVLALVYPLAYTAAHVPLAVGAVVALAFRVKGERLGARSGVALGLGTTAGVLLHPDFPRNVTLAWDQNVRVLAHAWTSSRLGVEQAVEFKAFAAREVAVASFPLWLALGTAVALVLLSDERRSLEAVKRVVLALGAALAGALFLEKANTRELLLWVSPFALGLGALLARSAARSSSVGADTAAALALAAAAVVGTMLSVRFLEYAAPLGTVALGLAVRDALASETTRARCRELARGWGLAGKALALVLGVLAVLASRKIVRQAIDCVALAEARHETAARWLASHARPGEVVFHAAWDAFPELFYFAPEQRYLVALDPAFIYYADPDQRRFDLWDAVSKGETDPARASELGCRFVVLDADAPRFFALERRLRAAASEKRLALRLAASGVEVWEIVRP